jgi:hypothetical protein
LGCQCVGSQESDVVEALYVNIQRWRQRAGIAAGDVSPGEVKQELLEVPTSTKNEIEFEFRLTMLDEPDEDPKYL